MNTKRRCSAELYADRSERMYLLLHSCHAPDILIAREARLLCEGFHGGKWRNVWQTILEAAWASWKWRVERPIVQALCRWNLYHYDMGLPSCGCIVCGKGAAAQEEKVDA